MSAARNAFSKRRKAYFAGLDQQRKQARELKEQIVAEAEELADSTDWGPTAARYRELMQQWKAAGRADRATEDALWSRFKGAQDRFFTARNAALAERDAELRGNAEIKEKLLEEARQALLPVTNPREARVRLRDFQERWDEVGPVPRDVRDRLEGGFRKIEEAVRKAEEQEWQRTNPEARARAEATRAQLLESIATLEKQLAEAREAGDERKATEAQESLAARQAWLAEVERTLAEMS